VHVGGASQRLRARLRCCQIERPMIRAQRVVEPALGTPDVAEADAAAEDVGEEAGPLEAVDCLGVRRVRCVEVAGGPVSEAGEGTGSSPGEIVPPV
jgi:hypothetical protein